MENNKIECINHNAFLIKMQQQCEKKKGDSCLAFIDINNAVQVARLLQGFWAEQQLIKRVEQIIIEHTFNLSGTVISKLNPHLFALIFEQPIQETVYIAEQLAASLDQKKIEINAYKTGTDSKVYYPKLNIGITPLSPAYSKAEHAITAAEEALYQARNVGNSIVKVIQPDNQSLHQYFDSLHSLPLLRAGLIEKHFILYAQPIVPVIAQQGPQQSRSIITL